jgi:hypothetical protein
VKREDVKKIGQRIVHGPRVIVHGLNPFFVSCVLFLAVVLLPAFSQNVEDIRDIRPPVAYPLNRLFWIAAIGAVLLAGAAWFLKKRLQFPENKAAAVLLKPAWVVAREFLNRLKEKDFPAKGMVREYYFELSYILRRYIEDRFLLRAPEMTTEEFLESLKDSSALSGQQKENLQGFLTGCDMVKFARYSAGREEMDKSFQLVEKFVDETILKET